MKLPVYIYGIKLLAQCNIFTLILSFSNLRYCCLKFCYNATASFYKKKHFKRIECFVLFLKSL